MNKLSIFGGLFVRNDSTGESKMFPTTKAGYAEAAAFRDETTQRGHHVSGDLGKIGDFFGSPSGVSGASSGGQTGNQYLHSDYNL